MNIVVHIKNTSKFSTIIVFTIICKFVCNTILVPRLECSEFCVDDLSL
jgi:hypothetical protein